MCIIIVIIVIEDLKTSFIEFFLMIGVTEKMHPITHIIKKRWTR